MMDFFSSRLFNQMDQLFDQANAQLRILITISIVALFFCTWLFLFALPTYHKTNIQSNKINIVEKNIAAIKYNYDNYQHIDQQSNEETQRQLQALSLELNQLQQHPLITKKLVNNTKDMQDLLQALAQTGSLLNLDHIQNLPDNKTAAKPFALESHGISIELHGNYFDTLHYLEYLEDLPWYIVFDSVEYQVGQYPNAKTKIILHALGNTTGTKNA